jgi:hypothetical protein
LGAAVLLDGVNRAGVSAPARICRKPLKPFHGETTDA